MKLDKVANSGNDEFYTPKYAIEPLLKYVPVGSIVWCPFDTENSLIVKMFCEHGCTVIATHISSGDDFFLMEIPHCDFIISNPPYSLKTEVLERLFASGKKFAMLLGVVGLFESERRFSLFESNRFEIMWMNKRIAYFKSYDEQKPSLNPPFSSVWLCRNVLPTGNVFERINKTEAARLQLARQKGGE